MLIDLFSMHFQLVSHLYFFFARFQGLPSVYQPQMPLLSVSFISPLPILLIGTFSLMLTCILGFVVR